MKLSERLEEGFQRRVRKARKNGSTNVCEDLGLDPTLPYRGFYEKGCEALGISEEEFRERYEYGAECALTKTDVVEFFPFTNLIKAEVELLITERQFAKEAG